MSCDHFDNAHCYMREFAKRLAFEIRDNDAEVQGYAPHFDISTLARLSVMQRLFDSCSELARQADLLYSSDTGEEDFKTAVDEIFQGLKT